MWKRLRRPIIEVEAYFDIDLVEGRLFWHSVSKYHSQLNGKEAGFIQCSNSKPYWYISIDQCLYKRGYLIFAAVHGRWPHPMLDHKDGDSLNDRPSNIRECTPTQNAWNHKKRARRIALPMGVRNIASGNFEARISFYGKQIHLGSFSTPGEASAVYQQKRKELYGQFA